MIIALVFTIVAIGLLCWLVSLLPLPAPFYNIVLGLLIIWAVLAVLEGLFGIHIAGSSLLLPINISR